MAPPPDTIDRAYEIMAASYIEVLTSNAAEAFVDGEVRATRLLRIPLNFHLINSRAVSATRDYRETLERFGGSDVTIVDEAGRVTRQFKPWLNDAIRSDKEEIGKIIESAVREGTPLKQVEQALDEVFAMREHNAQLTAYQETKSLFQKGTMDRFSHEGVQRATFIHMDPQEQPRPEHQALDGKVFDLDDDVWLLLNEPFCHCYAEPVPSGSVGGD